MTNDIKSIWWEPVAGEVCGVDAYRGPYKGHMLCAPISNTNIVQKTRDFAFYSDYENKDYEDRRIFEDFVGSTMISAYNTPKDSYNMVIDLAEILKNTSDPVKMQAAFNILKWYIYGLVGAELDSEE